MSQMIEPIPIQLSSVEAAGQPSEFDLQAKQLKAFNPYIQTQREEAYFTWLNELRALLQSGVVFTSDDVGLSRASQVYRASHSKQRRGLYQIPMPVLYVELYEPGRPRDLLISLLEGVGHQFRFGPIRDLRKRTWATLRDFGVEMVILDHADCLSFEALRELVHLKQQSRISIMLLADMRFKEVLARRKFVSIHNHFLNFHSFRPISKPEFQLMIQAWEEMSREFSLGLGLQEKELVAFLYERTGGLVQPLYDILKRIGVDRLSQGMEGHLTMEQLNGYCSSTFRAQVLKG